MSNTRAFRIAIAILVIGLAIGSLFASDKWRTGLVLADKGSQSGGQEKNAGQAFKNIQVLKDLPASQLMGVMNFFTASLGVNCDHCHVQPFEKDEKQNKQTARQMISMMQKINGENFAGKMRVNCATCHQGSTSPTSAAPLESAPRNQTDSTGGESAVTVDQVLDHYIKALGGKEAIQKVSSRAAKGTLTAPNGMKVAFQSIAAAPNKHLFILDSPAGVYKEGFNGSVGWVKNQSGQINDMSGSGLERTKDHADFYRDLKLKEQYASLNLVGKTVIGSNAVYELRGEKPSGTTERMYFDSRSGLLVRWYTEDKTAFGPLPEAIDFDDYRELSGVKVPFLVKRNRAGTIIVQRYEEINQNVQVDNAQFEKPTPQ